MSKLYQLAENYRKFNDYIEAAWDEDLSEDDLTMFIDTLEGIQDEIEVKVDNISKFLKNIESDIKAYKDEEERLAKRRKYLQNKFDGLKQYTQSVLEANGIDKVKTSLFNVRLQKNPPSVNILNEQLIPQQYRIPQPDKLANKEILEALKSGIIIEGAEIAPEKKHIRIT